MPGANLLTAELSLNIPGEDAIPFVSAKNRIHMFETNLPNCQVIGNAPAERFENLESSLFGFDPVPLWLEGVFHGSETICTLRIYLDSNLIGSDSIRIRVTPYIVLSNSDKVEQILISNNAAWGGFFDGATNVLSADFAYCEYGADFIQDRGEIGACHIGMDSGDSAITWSVFNFGGSVFKEFLAPDTAYFSGAYQGSGGDIEASPPDETFPNGRIIVGNNIHDNLRRTLSVQEVQTDSGELLTLPVDWLFVGHIDEIMAILPVDSGYKIVVGDIALALELLQLFPEENPYPPYASTTDLLACFSSADSAERIAIIQSNLAQCVSRLKTGLRLHDSDIIRIPVLYSLPLRSGAAYPVKSLPLLPNSVNMVFLDNGNGTKRILVPWAAFDPFDDYVQSVLEDAGFDPSEICFVNTDGPHRDREKSIAPAT